MYLTRRQIFSASAASAVFLVLPTSIKAAIPYETPSLPKGWRWGISTLRADLVDDADSWEDAVNRAQEKAEHVDEAVCIRPVRPMALELPYDGNDGGDLHPKCPENARYSIADLLDENCDCLNHQHGDPDILFSFSDNALECDITVARAAWRTTDDSDATAQMLNDALARWLNRHDLWRHWCVTCLDEKETVLTIPGIEARYADALLRAANAKTPTQKSDKDEI